ncbi:MAG: tyrosine--tRNA ligase [Patescibacteria group bacterium]|nr:tyrosine--tRNA ligase [Patescibacteria group bacterium]
MTNNDLLTRGVVEVIEKDHLEKTLQSGKKLRVKFGIDPTAPDLHLGHTVPLRKLRKFQDAGHQVVLIIGDFTARIGDPTGKNKARVPLTEKDVKANLKNYLKQAGKVLNVKKIETNYNGKWFLKGTKVLMEIMGAISMVRALERDDFQKRIKAGGDVTLLETIYSGLQGYDSVEVKADVEIGGTDQKFNMLMGRRMQRHYGMAEQDVITIPILEGTDGVHKMSKSLGNYIGLTEEPATMYAKTMSIPDTLTMKYAELLTDLPLADMESLVKRDPRAAKMKLAKEIVRMYHDEKKAQFAEEEFVRVVSNHEAPSEVKSEKLKVKSLSLADLLVETGMASSKGDARRLVEQGGVKIDNEKQSDPMRTVSLDGEILLQVGKHKFLKVSA